MTGPGHTFRATDGSVHCRCAACHERGASPAEVVLEATRRLRPQLTDDELGALYALVFVEDIRQAGRTDPQGLLDAGQAEPRGDSSGLICMCENPWPLHSVIDCAGGIICDGLVDHNCNTPGCRERRSRQRLSRLPHCVSVAMTLDCEAGIAASKEGAA